MARALPQSVKALSFTVRKDFLSFCIISLIHYYDSFLNLFFHFSEKWMSNKVKVTIFHQNKSYCDPGRPFWWPSWPASPWSITRTHQRAARCEFFPTVSSSHSAETNGFFSSHQVNPFIKGLQMTPDFTLSMIMKHLFWKSCAFGSLFWFFLSFQTKVMLIGLKRLHKDIGVSRGSCVECDECPSWGKRLKS